jgi:hypothetical protein
MLAKIPYMAYISIIRFLRFVDYFLGKEKITLDSGIRNRLVEKFKIDNKKLSEYLGRDLKKLGYL